MCEELGMGGNGTGLCNIASICTISFPEELCFIVLIYPGWRLPGGLQCPFCNKKDFKNDKIREASPPKKIIAKMCHWRVLVGNLKAIVLLKFIQKLSKVFLNQPTMNWVWQSFLWKVFLTNLHIHNGIFNFKISHITMFFLIKWNCTSWRSKHALGTWSSWSSFF